MSRRRCRPRDRTQPLLHVRWETQLESCFHHIERRVQAFPRLLNAHAKLDLGSVPGTAALQAREFDLVAKEAICELVEFSWAPSAHHEFAIGCFVPRLELDQRVGNPLIV